MSETLAFIIFPGFQLLDLSGPVEVFSSANPERGEPRYEVRVLAERAGLVTSSSGLALQAEALPEPQSLAGASLLVVGGPGVQAALQQGRLAGWLRDTAPLARRCASVCTGAFLLAQAGLLDERRALTHWRFAPLLQRLCCCVAAGPQRLALTMPGMPLPPPRTPHGRRLMRHQ